MIPDSAVPVAIAACCVVAIGLSATALERSVSTDPADVVDVDASMVPLGNDELGELERRVVRADDGDATGRVTTAGTGREHRTTAGTGSGEEQASAAGTTGERTGSVGEQQDAGSGPVDRSGGREDSGRSEERGPDEGTNPPTLRERLLALVDDLLVLLAAALLALLVRYRDRLPNLPSASAADAPATDSPPAPRPVDEVARAWTEMVRTLDLERRPSKTPTEYAAEAVAAGGDPTAVERLTDVFREVRYGGRPVTDDRRRRASVALDRLRDDQATTGGAERPGLAGSRPARAGGGR